MKQNPNITDEEIALIKSAKAGNMQAFNKLYYKYKGFTTNILYQYLKDFDEAKDVTNIVWLKVYNKLSKFVDYESFGGWLRILTNRTAIDYLRSTKHLLYAPEDYERTLTDESDYGTSIVDKMTYDQIIEVFKDFDDTVRRVFELFYIDNLTIEQIADALNMPKGTVKSHLSRKRKLIQKKFNKLKL